MNHKQPRKHVAIKVFCIVALLSLVLAAPALAQTYTWSNTGSLSQNHMRARMAMLSDGRVLIAGGMSQATAEVYDPSGGTWTTTGSMSTTRYDHTLTSLQNGRLLAAGGNGGSGMNTAETYNAGTGTWSSAGTMNYEHYAHTATQLQDGRVLVVGGMTSSVVAQNGAEIYDPGTGTWTPTAGMNDARAYHTATLLSDGRVLVAGGWNAGFTWLSSAEIFDPAGNGGVGSWTSTGAMTIPRVEATATLLNDGRVLMAAGSTTGDVRVNSAEIFDPAGNGGVGSWTSTGSMTGARKYHTATRLSDGRVMVIGGTLSSGPTTSCQIYDPAAGTWSAADDLNSALYLHQSILLTNGNVLAAGGTHAELFDSEDPDAITLASFTATAGDGGVRVAWETASELDNAGFNLYRSTVAEGGYVKLNATLIAAQGGPTQGASYSFDDAGVAPGATYYYTLEDVDLYGRTTSHGPVAVEVGQMPTAIRLVGMSASQPLGILVVVGLVLGVGGLVIARRRR